MKNNNLAIELVAQGLVSEEQQEELARYLECRERFLDRFRDEPTVARTLARYQEQARKLHRLADETNSQLGRYLCFLKEEVLPELEILLKGEPDRFEHIDQAIRHAGDGQIPTSSSSIEFKTVDDKLRALECVTELLVQVRDGLQKPGGAA